MYALYIFIHVIYFTRGHSMGICYVNWFRVHQQYEILPPKGRIPVDQLVQLLFKLLVCNPTRNPYEHDLSKMITLTPVFLVLVS